MPTLQLAPDTATGLAELHALLAPAIPPAGEAGPRRLAPRRDIFNDIVEEARLTYFDTKTSRAIKYTIAAYSLGFRAARAGEFRTAQAEFDRADELFALQQPSYSPPALAFLSCLTLPYRAYHCYSQGRFDASAEKTLAAITHITQLEDQIPVFHMARIQQLHNLSRVSFKRGAADAGATLVQELLRYLGTGATPAIAGGWAPVLLHRTPPTLRADMFGQVFLEMVSNLFYQPAPAQRRHLFSLAFGQLSNLAAATDFWPPYQAWLAAYEALLFAEASDYAPLLAAYLRAEPDHSLDLLRLALLLELHRRLPPTAGLRPLLPAYARRTLWVGEHYLGLLA